MSETAAPGPSDARTIWFDVGFLFLPNKILTGVQRVTLSILQELLALSDRDIRFCAYQEAAARFEAVSRAAVVSAIDGYFEPTPSAEGTVAPAAPLSARRTVRRVAGRLVPERLRPSVKQWLVASRDVVRAMAPRAEKPRQRRPASAPPAGEPTVSGPFARGDVFINAHLIYYPVPHLAAIERFLQGQGVVYVGIVFDLTPFLFPEYWGAAAQRLYLARTEFIVRGSSVVLAISESTKRDLLAWMVERKLPQRPVEVVILGSDLIDADQPEEQEVLNPALPAEPFVLSVGTIEVRKNHALLFAVWKALLKAHGEAVPLLVFAGKLGWLTNDLQEMLRNSGHLGGKIRVISGLSDQQLKQFYQRSLFTLYPSLYEGWGLPVAEALGYGKYTIASNASSIPEIGGDLVDYHDPRTFSECYTLVEHALLNPDHVQAKAQRVKAEYRAPTWQACTQALLATLDQLSPAAGRPSQPG